MNDPIIMALAEARMRQIEQTLLNTPVEVLQEAKRRQDIEAHNTGVMAAKAQRKALSKVMRGQQLRDIAEVLRKGNLA